MAAIALPAYASPMMAMSQLGSMFQHGNSVGGAFTLLTLGAGTNLGLVLWMQRTYGLRQTAAWLGLLLAVVIGLSYGVERPLYPSSIEAADHTHAFDIYCRPFGARASGLPQRVVDKIREDTQIHEAYSAALLGALLCAGIVLRLFDPRFRAEAWLERPTAVTQHGPAWYNVSLPASVLGLAALLILFGLSVVGCYTYYPSPNEALEQIATANTETLSAALVGDRKRAEHWIPIYADWVRKLQVGVYLRTGRVSEFHRAKTRILLDRLELLEHELAEGDKEAVGQLVGSISRALQRLRWAFLLEPQAVFEGRIARPAPMTSARALSTARRPARPIPCSQMSSSTPRRLGGSFQLNASERRL